MTARMRERYESEIRPALVKEFEYGNEMRAPALKKIVVNIGLGEAIQNARALDAASADLTTITGQKPVTTRGGTGVKGARILNRLAQADVHHNLLERRRAHLVAVFEFFDQRSANLRFVALAHPCCHASASSRCPRRIFCRLGLARRLLAREWRPASPRRSSCRSA